VIVASGMLTVGAGALIAGIVALFLSKEINIEKKDKTYLRIIFSFC
jgi:hypothetical protein